MKCRSLSAAAALAMAGALVLTACTGSDGEPSDNGKTAGADTGSEASASPRASASASATASAPTSVERPRIELPSDVTDKFENWQAGDEAKNAVLADTARRIDATNDAILRGDTGARSLSFYYRGKALNDALRWVQAYVDANMSFTGTTRYYAPEVALSGESEASVVYCADESKGFNKDRKTNKVDRTPSDQSPYVLYSARLQKSGQGVWRTTSLTSKRGDKACTP
ncbi:hypothetical protein [Streptomyces sp. NBC_00280]|uniref:hypothetical protein n=1 Tax=Streptomyces sp. NBC_00280 TaxID=2975699 RepID=UPI003248A171